MIRLYLMISDYVSSDRVPPLSPPLVICGCYVQLQYRAVRKAFIPSLSCKMSSSIHAPPLTQKRTEKQYRIRSPIYGNNNKPPPDESEIPIYLARSRACMADRPLSRLCR
jgi:hypothetical protein